MNKWFSNLEAFLNTDVVPIANYLDSNQQALANLFYRFKQFDILKLFVPPQSGGFGADAHFLVQYNRLLANYSAALLFLQGQHQYAVMELSRYPMTARMEILYNDIIVKQYAMAVCFIAGKRLTVVPEGDSFRLSGLLPWVSGYGIFADILIAFYHNDLLYYALVPFKHCHTNQSRIHCSESIDTVVVNAVNTVSVEMKNWCVNPYDIVCCIEPEAKLDSLPHPTIYSFAGVSQALLKTVEQSHCFDEAFMQKKYRLLQAALHDYLEKIAQPIDAPLALRAQGYKIASACGEFARLALSRTALLSDSTVQRLCREVWLYSTIAFKPEQLSAYLDTLTIKE